MPRIQWPLHRGRPCVEVLLLLASRGQSMHRTLLADTGAGSQQVTFELILTAQECLNSGGVAGKPVKLGRACTGAFPTYESCIQVPALGFNQKVQVVRVPSGPPGFASIACFPFLNRFSHGNFGDPDQFGLEC